MTLFVGAANTVGVAVISLVFMVGGYLLLAVLWYLMVYRPSRRERLAREQRLARGRGPEPAPPGADRRGGVDGAASTGERVPGDEG